jgi:hypothetical protein
LLWFSPPLHLGRCLIHIFQVFYGTFKHHQGTRLKIWHFLAENCFSSFYLVKISNFGYRCLWGQLKEPYKLKIKIAEKLQIRTFWPFKCNNQPIDYKNQSIHCINQPFQHFNRNRMNAHQRWTNFAMIWLYSYARTINQIFRSEYPSMDGEFENL